MNGKLTALLLVLALVLVLAAASLSYQKLSSAYKPAADGPSPEKTEDAVPAADFTVLDGEGNPVSLSDFQGKPVVVNFWATWCGPCKAELPYFDALYTEYGGSVQFLMVNMTDGTYDTIESVKDFVSGEGYGFPVYYDTEMSAAAAYAVQSIPRTLFIRADGSLAAEQIGMMEEGTLREKIGNLIR